MSDKTAGGHELLRGRETGQVARESDVRALYEHAPYPDLGAGLKDPAPVLARIPGDLLKRPRITYLEAGCGTGHMLVSVAKRYPGWDCHGIDLSQASLEVAKKLSESHGASVTLHALSYLDDLPFEKETLDIISAQGTIHHCDDPVGALNNLASYLRRDGHISMHVYGARLDAGKFDLKEAISLFEPDLSAHSERFAVYQALAGHRGPRGRLRAALDISLLDIFRWLRRGITNLARRSRKAVWSPPWTDRYAGPSAPWADHFCHPCERAYEVPDFRALIEGAGLEVVHMQGQGRVERSLVPAELRARFDALAAWDQWRLMELIGPARSFSVILRKG